MARRREIREVFELTRPRVHLATDHPVYVHARNRSGAEQAQLILTEEIEDMFGERNQMFVKAWFDRFNNLNIIEEVEKPNGWRR